MQNEHLKNEEKAVHSLRELYESYGYQQFRMSKFEEYELYVRNKDFLISDNIITFTDQSGKLMALKPDVTLSIVKNTRIEPGCVRKVYYNENVYRRSMNGAFREILQTGLECIGDLDGYCLSEVLLLAVESLSRLSPDFLLAVSHIGVLADVLDAMNLPSAVRGKLLTCIGQKNTHDVDAICAEAGVPSERAGLLRRIMTASGKPECVIAELRNDLRGNGTDAALAASIEEKLAELERILAALPLGHVYLDFSAVNDLNYYNGIVFQGFVSGIPERVLSGGQYDPLMQKMGRRERAIGFAVYLDRLEALLTERRDYDVDTVLLYDDTVDPAALAAELRIRISGGENVSAMRVIPEKLRYRRVIRMTENGGVDA